MITIHLLNGKTFDEALRENDLLLSREIITSVCDAIELGVSRILVARFIFGHEEEEYMDIMAVNVDFLVCLKVNMKALIDAEEYELCARAKKYIDLLEQPVLLLN